MTQVQVFKEACQRNKVYGVFSITGEQHPDPEKAPFNTLIMITDEGKINLVSVTACDCLSTISATA